MGKRGKGKKKESNMAQIVQKSLESFGSLSNQTANHKATTTTKKYTYTPTYTPTYTYKGRLNQTDFPEFIEVCKKTQKELIEWLPEKLREAGYESVIVDDGFIYAKGDLPYILTAHMDTVHKEPVKNFYEDRNDKGQHVITSPQGIGGDDRCGIYIILDIIKEFKPSVLFCEDEEVGGVGSQAFCMHDDYVEELSKLKYFIELDRMDSKDAVFYDCDNPEFTDFIVNNTNYHEDWGTFSDISVLAPVCGVAAVNLSVGYYNAHTLKESVVVEEMFQTRDAVKHLFTLECEQFIYMESRRYGNYPYGGNNWYGGWYDEEDYYLSGKTTKYGGYYYGNAKDTEKIYGADDEGCDDEHTGLYVMYYDHECEIPENFDFIVGRSEEHAWLKFFQTHPDACWNDVLDYYVSAV